MHSRAFRGGGSSACDIVLVHDYSRIDVGRVWEVVQQDIPDLIRKTEPLAPPPEPGVQAP